MKKRIEHKLVGNTTIYEKGYGVKCFCGKRFRSETVREMDKLLREHFKGLTERSENKSRSGEKK